MERAITLFPSIHKRWPGATYLLGLSYYISTRESSKKTEKSYMNYALSFLDSICPDLINILCSEGILKPISKAKITLCYFSNCCCWWLSNKHYYHNCWSYQFRWDSPLYTSWPPRWKTIWTHDGQSHLVWRRWYRIFMSSLCRWTVDKI